MSAAYVEIATTTTRIFVEALLHLGSVGGTIPDDVGAFKGTIMRTKIKVPDIKQVKLMGCMRVVPIAAVENNPYVLPATISMSVVEDKPVVAPEPKEAPEQPESKTAAKLTAEQLEGMTLAEVRKATGITEGGKAAIIKQYLEQA